MPLVKVGVIPVTLTDKRVMATSLFLLLLVKTNMVAALIIVLFILYKKIKKKPLS
ncbi:hypothetical protein ACR74Y_12830 [Lacticaseibacillus rhamnosus]|uniref:hypothetical protein n=1 Tax=Lacticaseibacillus rhamnosus TaxID=47715 RepID=UPI00138E353E|nr:hypothetical protein [Lacticaseibacillus rhamnosus]